MLKAILSKLVFRKDDVVVMDMEAGLEHLGRGTASLMDQFVVVIEPGARSIQTYARIKELAKDSEDAAHILPETELPMNATGAETLENVWALFETATRLDTRREREALFDLAGELAECQNLADWLKETPGEAQQQDSCPEMAMAM